MMEQLTQTEVKSLTLEDYQYIFEGRAFKTQPRKHQFASMLWAWPRNRVVFLHDIGTGKTLSAIYTAMLWGCQRILVVCPTSVQETWREELSRHVDWPFEIMSGSAAERKQKQAASTARVHIVNYEGLKCLFGSLKKINTKQSQWVLDMSHLNASPYDCLICDEFHKLKGATSTQTKCAYHVSRAAKYVIMLSGTPIAKDVGDFWSEFMVLDDGITLGRNQFEFMTTYFERVQITPKSGHPFWLWNPRKGTTEKLLEKVLQTSIRYDRTECIDLPELVEQKRYVTPSAEQRSMTSTMLRSMKVQLEKGELTISNVLNVSAKLSQISSGFVMAPTGTEFLKSNPKLDELMSVLEEFESKCIVFHNYQEEGRMIEHALAKAKIKYASLRGEIKDKPAQIRRFKDDPAVRILVAHPQSGGEGLNLQVANVVVFYSQISSGATTRLQCIGRVHRSGQTERCIVVDLITRDTTSKLTVDEKTYATAIERRDQAQAMLDFIRDS